MKSEHRHELETNVLAKRLADFIEQMRPYASTVVGIAAVVVVAIFGFSYMSGASAARQGEAWSTYNQAVEGLIPNLDVLRRSAEEHAGTTMEQWANITWADGQVWMAARAYLQNRSGAMEALKRATGAYQSLLAGSDDQQIISRAHFGLGRIYELQNQLDRAREEYAAVQGEFAMLAEMRASELAKTETKGTYDWLATAEAPRRAPPSGPGTPGQRPAFSAGELDLPTSGKSAPSGAATSVEDLFEGIASPGESENRYDAADEDPEEGGAVDSSESDATGAADAADGDAPLDKSTDGATDDK